MIASPDDQDARYGSKDGSTWTGYKIHLTETGERNAPRLVTHIETTVATSRDATVTEKVQDDLIARSLEPEAHLADGGYMDADNLVSSQAKEIDLVGPVRPDNHCHSKVEGAYDVSRFEIDWEKKMAVCREGQSSRYWKRSKRAHGQLNEHFIFKRSVCHDCDARSLCTKAEKMGRILTIYPEEKHEALQAARERQKTDAFKLLYYQRSGIEGAVSKAVRGMSIRRSRYRDLARLHLQRVASPAAINLTRVADWLSGMRPKSDHCSPFAVLAMQC